MGGIGWSLAGFSTQPWLASLVASGGFIGGYAGGAALLSLAPATAVFSGLRLLLALLFVALAAIAGRALLHPGLTVNPRGMRATLAWSAATGILAGVVTSGRVPLAETHLSVVIGLGLVGLLAPLSGLFLGRWLAPLLPLTGVTAALLGGGFILLLAAYAPRLDLFAPLSMKVMKFAHDAAHQLFETLLLPDHPFLKSEIWDFIGFFFSTSVGVWLGGLIWLLPPLAGVAAIALQPLPSVAELRSGPARRLTVAGLQANRRRLLRAPLLAGVVYAAALWRSLAPVTEYWDPPPIAVTADSAGRIIIPRATPEYDLADGRLRKFAFHKGRSTVRFFLLQKPDGRLIGSLDACAICPPDGYGQGEGSVICYYCRTLIPLETVGVVGGCNPVPIPVVVDKERIVIENGLLRAAWLSAVQPRKNVPRRVGGQ